MIRIQYSTIMQFADSILNNDSDWYTTPVQTTNNNTIIITAVLNGNARPMSSLLAILNRNAQTRSVFDTQQAEMQSIFSTQQQSCERKRWLDLPDTQGIGGTIYSTPKSSNVFPCSNTQLKRLPDIFPYSSSIVCYGILNACTTSSLLIQIGIES